MAAIMYNTHFHEWRYKPGMRYCIGCPAWEATPTTSPDKAAPTPNKTGRSEK